ncbi:LysR substrate-binding domain-containing protein [Microbaculum marinisediminis]|uniref:LysR substrate-binding domain-containing protein n=1 Tax=Microbaculum marinisediminis TaxID=2931392 RepID=A0AAW5QVG4_9HYPH|nr:LysR substrate-binding domain-containing protein [Microbaculum sp. A6E488]MCT8971499.1 LysR substrate-binding domain-containing protein [Microbaculum sp. A6E488]
MSGALNLKQIDAFRWVMISGSTSQAAAILNVSQPAVSRLLKNFEGQVEYQLFIRSGGRLHPTPEAEALLREIERVYPGLTHLSNLMQNIALIDSGLVRIIATMPMMQRLVPEALYEFHREMPQIRSSVKTIVKRELREWLDGQQFDIGLATLPVDYLDANIMPLASLNCACVLPPGHPMSGADVIHARDLADEPFISIIPDTILRSRVDRVFDKLGVQRRLMIETQSAAAICEMAAAGLGVSVVDIFTASGFADKGILVKPFRPAIKLQFGILLPVQRPQSNAVEALIEIVRKRAKGFEESYRNF